MELSPLEFVYSEADWWTLCSVGSTFFSNIESPSFFDSVRRSRDFHAFLIWRGQRFVHSLNFNFPRRRSLLCHFLAESFPPLGAVPFVYRISSDAAESGEEQVVLSAVSRVGLQLPTLGLRLALRARQKIRLIGKVSSVCWTYLHQVEVLPPHRVLAC